MHMLDGFGHGAFFREVDGLRAKVSTRAARKANGLAHLGEAGTLRTATNAVGSGVRAYQSAIRTGPSRSAT
jgi:hypothetical protein